MIDFHGVIYSAMTGANACTLCAPAEYCISDDLVSAIRAESSRVLDICVDSPGGDFFAAGSVVNEVSAWLRKDSDRVAQVFVGSMALSAAAYFVASLPKNRVEVYAHRNSVFMFHCVHSDAVDAGADALRDQADAQDRCDAAIRSALLYRTTISPAQVDQWLSEGREGWLSASEAAEVGLVDAVLDAEAEPFVFSEDTTPKKEPTAMNLPYLKQLVKNLKTVTAEPVAIEGPAPVEPAHVEDEPIPAEPVAEEELPAPVENPEASALKKEVESLRAELKALQEELLKSTMEKEEAQNVAAKLTTGLRAAAPVFDSSPDSDFHAALRDYRAAHPGIRYSVAFANVAKENPALYQSMFHH